MTKLESKHYNGSEPRAIKCKINNEFDNIGKDSIKGRTINGKNSD